MATYLADRVIVFEGSPAVAATATPYVLFVPCMMHSKKLMAIATHCRPQSLLTGMNKFLQSLEITFRRDPTNFRPRVNKLHSVKDKEQKGLFLVDVSRAPSDDLLFSIGKLLLPRGMKPFWRLRRPSMDGRTPLDPLECARGVSPTEYGSQGQCSCERWMASHVI